MYIKINGSDEHYDAYVSPFKTQHGNSAIRVIGEMPETDKGFKIYDDQDKVFSDFSDYVYLYNPNEYTTVDEKKEYASISFQPLPPSSYDELSSRISQINSQVQEITPYTDSKNAYIDDTECIFENVYKDGALTVNVVDRNGVSIEYNVVKEDNNIIVTFEPLEEVATVSIVIQ